MDTTYIIVFQDGSKRHLSNNELDLSIYMTGGPVTIYCKEDFIAQSEQYAMRLKPTGNDIFPINSAGF